MGNEIKDEIKNKIKAIHDVIITPLKRFPDDRGTVMHIMKATDNGFNGFGEVYCSTIYPGITKGWNLHSKTTLNYVAINGTIQFILFDDRQNSPTKNTIQKIFMGDQNYVRVTVPPGIWSAFQCIGTQTATVCNIINHPHDPNESQHRPLDDPPHQGGLF